MDGDAAFGLAVVAAVMGVTVEHAVERIAIQRLLQPAAAEEGIDFQRLVRDRVGMDGYPFSSQLSGNSF